jgi:hypothetical protein
MPVPSLRFLAFCHVRSDVVGLAAGKGVGRLHRSHIEAVDRHLGSKFNATVAHLAGYPCNDHINVPEFQMYYRIVILTPDGYMVCHFSTERERWMFAKFAASGQCMTNLSLSPPDSVRTDYFA